MANDDDGGYSEYFDDYAWYEAHGYDDYVATAREPSRALFIATAATVIGLMACCMPLLLLLRRELRHRQKKRRQKKAQQNGENGGADGLIKAEDQDEKADHLQEAKKKRHSIKSSIWAVLRLDKESIRLWKYVAPFTLYNTIEAFFEIVELSLVAHFIGSKPVTGYALTLMILELASDFLHGPIAACTTLCAQAVGANIPKMAGEYVQLAVTFYVMTWVPLALVSYFFMYDLILWLEWGDKETAELAQEFNNWVVWAVLFDGILQAYAELLEVTDHEIYTVIMGLAHHGTIIVILIIMATVDQVNFKLAHVGMLHTVGSFFFGWLTLFIAHRRGWLRPFHQGLYESLALLNYSGIRVMMKTAVPLGFGSIIVNAEWSILTVFASHMGAAEVAAFAILGWLWELFESVISGIGDSAEIRVAYHLGNNQPQLAKLSSFKALFIGMLMASLVTILIFAFINKIPGWFTPDPTLEQLFADTLPYIAIGNLALSFGDLCWYMIGAQGRYKLATIVHFITSWAITLPLAGFMTYGLGLNLEGLASSVVLGYVGVGFTMALLLFTSNWKKVAQKVVARNEKALAGTFEHDFEGFAALTGRKSRAAKSSAMNNIKLFTAPPGKLYLQIGHLPSKKGVYVTSVLPQSPFSGRLHEGDCILAVDRYVVTNESAVSVYELMAANSGNYREFLVMTSVSKYQDGDSKQVRLGEANDIADFEEEEIPEDGDIDHLLACADDETGHGSYSIF